MSRSGASVIFAGDWAPIRAFEPLVRADPESVYGDLLPVLRTADLRVVNCESALATSGSPVWKSGATFKGDPAHVRGLTAVPFEIACLANNHVFDYGAGAFDETLDLLRSGGIRTIGAGRTGEEAWAPLSVPLGGTRLHLVNFCEGEDLTAARGGPGVAGWEIERAGLLVGDLKAKGGLVVAVVHAGLEYVPFPPPYIRRAFRAMVEAGADAVIGHHPHVPQGIEIHKGRPIAYSLGNFVFHQPTDLHWRKTGFLFELKIEGEKIRGFGIHPYRISGKGIRALGKAESAAFRKAFGLISKPLGTDSGHRKAWDAWLAFYGIEGLKREIGGILEKMESEPPKGAAMLRNRITTPQHAELWSDILTRFIGGGSAPDRNLAGIVEEWLTRKADDGPQARP